MPNTVQKALQKYRFTKIAYNKGYNIPVFLIKVNIRKRIVFRSSRITGRQ